MQVYLDYAATTPLEKAVLEKMLPYFTEHFGNPSSLHTFGRRADIAVASARDKIASLLGAKSSEIYFTSGGTEADNWAVDAFAPNQKIAVFQAEHAAVLSPSEKREVVYIKPDQNGAFRLSELEKVIDLVGAVFCMAVNNETGVIQPLKEISALCKKRGVLLFSDCVQAANVLDLKELFALTDGISLSGHKIYGPKGVGVLAVKEHVKLRPFLLGGEQERGKRGGTLNTAAIVGMAEALFLSQSHRVQFVEHTKKLQSAFEAELLQKLPSCVIDGVNRVPNISHVTFPKGSEALLNRLDLEGIACSGGAACSAHAALPSHVMLAMGKSEEESLRAVRFSFGKDTAMEEVISAAQKAAQCVFS